MRRRFGIAYLLAAFALPLSVHAQSRIDCDALNSRILKHPVHYCIYLPSGYDAGAATHPIQAYPVLYFLHGLGDNERTLFNTGGWTLLDDLRQQHRIGEFLIAAPEGGQTFFQKHADTFLIIDDQDSAALDILVVIFRRPGKRLGRNVG